MSKRFIFTISILVSFASLLGLAGCSDGGEKPLAPTYKTNLTEKERDSSVFKNLFPEQYHSYRRNDETGPETATKYKASYSFHKNDGVHGYPIGKPGAAQEYLKTLWLGYPFSWEYNEARGHTHAVEDILNIDRINRYGENGGLPATCWNCKTTKVLDWEEAKGDAFWAGNFNEYRSKDQISPMNNSIGCDTCHNPVDMSLRVTSIPFKEAMARQGIDLSKATRNEMRSYVCGQCHGEYYFQEAVHGANKKVIFPWDNGGGQDFEAMYQYYQTKGPKKADGTFDQFVDWVHPVTKVKLLKAQHPDFETWKDGPHGSAGVACADCHMPYIRVDGKKKISQHQWTSPMRSTERIINACGQCHADKTPEYLKSRVESIQDRTYATLIETEELSVKAHEAVRRAMEWTGERAANYDKLLADARENIRKGQFFWDMVSAENGVGFHNPTKALRTLIESKSLSQKAIDLASAATNYGISSALAEDIHKLVPPIMQWSRELQMDPENLKNHVWTKYLPALPKTKKVWDGQERLVPKPVTSNKDVTSKNVSMK